MTASLIRVEVTDEHGTAVHLIGTSGLPARPAQRSQLTALADGLTASIARILGCDENYARSVAVADLTRLVADGEAYERVAARRGLLPL